MGLFSILHKTASTERQWLHEGSFDAAVWSRGLFAPLTLLSEPRMFKASAYRFEHWQHLSEGGTSYIVYDI